MTEIRVGLARFLVLALVGLVTACGGNSTVPENHYYRLGVAASAAQAAKKVDGVIEVDRLLSTGALAQRAMVYRQADNPNQLLAYHYHFWNDAPGEMMQAELVRYLRGAGIADKVVTPEMRARPSYAVTGRVSKLERVIGGAPAGALEMTLVFRRVSDNQVLLSRTYARDVAPKDDSLTSLVQAFSVATGDIFKAFVDDIAKAL